MSPVLRMLSGVGETEIVRAQEATQTVGSDAMFNKLPVPCYATALLPWPALACIGTLMY